MKKITSLTEFEIEAKVEDAIQRETQRGTNRSDISRKHMEGMFEGIRDSLSPVAKEALVYEGILSLAKKVLGAKIAEEVWKSGTGWAATSAEVRTIGARLKIDDPEECFTHFRETVMDLTIEEAADFPALSRFMPLFVVQAADATIGEIATRKAAARNNLAISLLTWKEGK